MSYIILGLAAIVSATSFACAQENADAVQQPKQELREVSFEQVKLNDNFWAPRIDANRTVSVPHNIKWCETETKRIDNFKIAAGLQEGEFGGIFFDDSDVYKILEGFAYTLSAHPDEKLLEKTNEWIDYIGGAQQDDGYLMCYFTIAKPDEKWTNLAGMHELYCAGHMAEAAVAYQRATGSDKFVKISRRLLDLICKRYGPNEGQLVNVAGHEEIELALVKMYQLTGEQKYLNEAKFFIDARGVAEGREKGLFGEYCQDHMPVREQTEIVGHAVRAMYLYCGATDVAGYFKDAELLAAMRRIFTNLTRNKMYITGGIGSSRLNEGFEENFKLPNQEAYCETCAAIGMVFWSHRMNLATGEAQYADVMERAAYNGFMSGYSLSGDKYFYVNPLESRGDHHREPFFGCACCPSNVIRALPSMPGYFYATTESDDAKAAGSGDDTIVVNMFGQSKATIELADKNVTIEQSTRYPYDGAIAIRTSYEMKNANAKLTPFYLKVRVPQWSGQPSEPDGYRTYKINPMDKTTALTQVNFNMPVTRMIANPNVKADLGRVALQRGPLVYCFEDCDNPDARVDRIILPKDPEFKVQSRKYFIASRLDTFETRTSKARTVDVITCKDIMGRDLTAIPYCVWDNRDAGRMDVWVRQAGLDVEDDSPVMKEDDWIDENGDPILYKALDPSILSDSVPELPQVVDFSGSFYEDKMSTFEYANQAATVSSSADLEAPRATWWARKGSLEWFKYEFPAPRKLTSVSVYWFDDEAANGGCRIPESWKLSYRAPNSDVWEDVPVKGEYVVAKDKAVCVEFDEIEVDKLRLEARLQPGFSGGILQWTVK
ncbi:MAG: glycoside hydrolase family 127 protein [Planctomycetia bacterium]|nr:glycoside hydrolase family 127 protein [Planctomycetia bacterium]